MQSKKLGFFNKLLVLANSIAVILLLVSFALPYVSPKEFPTISLLSLAVSPLIFINLIFTAYWLFSLKRMALLSGIVVLFAYFHFKPFFEFSSDGNTSDYQNTLSILSYNVRLFNAYEKEPSIGVSEIISEIQNNTPPDIICIQEYYRASTFEFSIYPYQYIHFKDSNNKLGHAIFSKYPIVKKGAFDFKNSYNNVIYADVVKGSDTVRIYNLHLQSLGIIPRVEFLQDGDKERLRKRMSRAFIMQETQANTILEHKKASPYPVILAGDLNNTSFSYVFRQLQAGMHDAFVERGSGIGTTFKFDGYPMRIDYILTTESLDVISFETLDKSFSDHYPIKAVIGW